MADRSDPYKTLQVDPEAEDDVIKAAYRRLARKYHPDLAPTDEAADRMRAINAAWELIGDPVARAEYDRRRSAAAAAGHPPAGPTAPGATAGQRSSRPPDVVSPDWTSGRSSQGGGYDPSMRKPEGHGAAGPPPGHPSGTVLNFGRYAGWSLGEVARKDVEYLEWLDRAPIGRNYRQEIDELLRSSGRRRAADKEAADRHGLYRRR
jgi:curved DNA-binding protein CbpA